MTGLSRALSIATLGLAATAAAAAGGPVERGRAIALSRSQGLCVLCHALPGTAPHEQGTLGPDLAGVASRYDPLTLRRRVLEPEAFNPETIMPSYGRLHHPGAQVPPQRQGLPLLGPQELADLMAFLETLR